MPLRLRAALGLTVLSALLVAVAGAGTQPPAPAPKADAPKGAAQPERKFLTGARLSPRSKLAATPRFIPAATPPKQFTVVPPKLSIWNNSVYGDCVSAQAALSIAWYTYWCSGQEVFATDQEVVNFASKYGYLNGASLTSVMYTMQHQGMVIGGKTYREGPYSVVAWASEPSLQAAIATGPVNIAIDSNALPSTAGRFQGWYSTGGRVGQFPNTDHCVAITGYGPPSYLAQTLGVATPPGLDPAKTYYHLFTWGTIGIVDHDWLMSTTEEAYVRYPTTQGYSPPPDPALPAAPASLTTTAGPGQIDVRWPAVATATGYKIYRGTTPGGEAFLWATSGNAGNGTVDQTVTPGVTYYYQVTATNAAGEGPRSAESSAVPLAPTPPAVPATPTGLTIQGQVNQVEFRWAVVSGATSYKLYRGTAAGGETFFKSVPANGIIDQEVTPGTAYYYQVTAVNAAGESPRSGEISATPTAAPPPTPTTGLSGTLTFKNGVLVAHTLPPAGGAGPVPTGPFPNYAANLTVDGNWRVTGTLTPVPAGPAKAPPRGVPAALPAVVGGVAMAF